MSAAKHSCCATVYSGMWPGKCAKAGTYEHGGKRYCRVHHPDTVAAKEAAKRERWAAEDAARNKAMDDHVEQVRRANCYPDLLAALQAMVDSYEHEASAENPALLQARLAIDQATGVIGKAAPA